MPMNICTPVRGKNKGVFKIQLKTCEDKIDVLRKKSNLRNSVEFKKVYLCSSKSHTDRLIETNFKTLLHEIPNGNLYCLAGNGRILKKFESESAAGADYDIQLSQSQQRSNAPHLSQSVLTSQPRSVGSPNSASYSTVVSSGGLPQAAAGYTLPQPDSVMHTQPPPPPTSYPGTMNQPVSHPGLPSSQFLVPAYQQTFTTYSQDPHAQTLTQAAAKGNCWEQSQSLKSPFFADLHLTVATWNINGWTLTNSTFRTELLKSVLPDVICLCETHLHSQKTILMVIHLLYITENVHLIVLTRVQVGLQF